MEYEIQAALQKLIASEAEARHEYSEFLARFPEADERLVEKIREIQSDEYGHILILLGCAGFLDKIPPAEDGLEEALDHIIDFTQGEGEEGGDPD